MGSGGTYAACTRVWPCAILTSLGTPPLLPHRAGAARREQGGAERPSRKLRSGCYITYRAVIAQGARATNPLTLRGLVLRTGPILHEGDTSSGSDRATPRIAILTLGRFHSCPPKISIL